MEVLAKLKADGISAQLVRDELAIDVPGRPPVLFRVVDSRHPSKAAPDGNVLILKPFVSPDEGRRLSRLGWSWADLQGNCALRAPGLIVDRRVQRRPGRVRRTLPHGVGSWGIIRFLVTRAAKGEAVRTLQAASAGEVSQPRASQVLKDLWQLGLVRKERGGWRVDDPNKLLDRFLAEYPGPGGSEMALYSLASPGETAAHLRDALLDRGVAAAFSADVAPDLVRPWRVPTHLIVYSPVAIDIEWTGLTQARQRADANVLLREPADVSVFRGGARNVSGDRGTFRLVDPVQVMWDLGQLGGEDRLEAAERIRPWVLGS